MDVTPNYNLIPYPDQDYQLKPYVSQSPVLKQEFGQEPIAADSRFQQHHSNNHNIHLKFSNQTYGVRQTLVYLSIDQVGHLIDIYA